MTERRSRSSARLQAKRSNDSLSSQVSLEKVPAKASPARLSSPTKRASPRKSKSQSTLSKDQEPLIAKEEHPNAMKDLGNIVLLVVLCSLSSLSRVYAYRSLGVSYKGRMVDLLQGVPLGLVFASVPYLLKEKLSYGEIALFSLAQYPYSLKLLWSPLVDSMYSTTIGRRKSWIIPTQAIIGISFVLLGSRLDAMFEAETLPVTQLSLLFFAVVVFCATQDIAVDGWALTLLRPENKTYASTAQTIGLNTGYFLSFTVFLALNSAEFCNKYLRSVPLDKGLLQLGSYLQFWGICFLLVDVWLLFFKSEDMASHEPDEDFRTVYRQILDILHLPHMKTLVAILLVSKIGFIAHESVSGLKLIEKGFHKEDLALAVLFDFPFQIIFGYYAAKWSSGSRPLRPWLYAMWGRLFFIGVGILVVWACPVGNISSFYFVLVLLTTTAYSFMSTVQFVGLGSFFTKISDPAIGGTYMTLLNTLSNFGGTWPKYFILKLVDATTDATCSITGPQGETLDCVRDVDKDHCTKVLGGTCATHHDGFYVVAVTTWILGLTAFLVFIFPAMRRLESLHDHVWWIKKRAEA